jgi:L-ascorbate metabolism protein UlaG (beta-lactamase superfamily)
VRPKDIEFAPDELKGSDPTLRVRWLGTAGFAIEHQGWVLLIDPYLTRPSLGRCLLSSIEPDLPTIRRYVTGADGIICGHTHFDHVLDVPAIARFTGAQVFGSTSAVTLCRAGGIAAERLHDVQTMTDRSEARAELGPFELRFVPGEHSPLLGGKVPFPGDITDCNQVPHRMGDYRCGAVFNVAVTVAGRTIYHTGSANLRDDVGPSIRDIDLLLLCVAGWTATPRLVERLLSKVTPDAVLLSHWDNFFSPIERGAQLMPAIKLPQLVDDLTRQSSDLRVGTVPLMGELVL